MTEWLINFFTAGFESALNKILIQQQENFQMLNEKLQSVNTTVEELKALVTAEREQVQGAIATLSETVASQQQTINDLLAQVSDGTISLQEAEAQADAIAANLNDAIAAVSAIYDPEPITPVEPA